MIDNIIVNLLIYLYTWDVLWFVYIFTITTDRINRFFLYHVQIHCSNIFFFYEKQRSLYSLVVVNILNLITNKMDSIAKGVSQCLIDKAATRSQYTSTVTGIVRILRWSKRTQQYNIIMLDVSSNTSTITTSTTTTTTSVVASSLIQPNVSTGVGSQTAASALSSATSTCTAAAIADAFDIFDHSGNRTIDVRELGTVLRYLGKVVET